MRAGAIAILLLASTLWSAPAVACRVASNQTPLLHETLPPLEPGMVAAEVEIVTDVRKDGGPLEAQVLLMLEGSYAPAMIKIEPTVHSSCDGIPSVGTRGIVVGYVLSSTGDQLVVDPLRAPSERQRELQAGAQASAAH